MEPNIFPKLSVSNEAGIWLVYQLNIWPRVKSVKKIFCGKIIGTRLKGVMAASGREALFVSTFCSIFAFELFCAAYFLPWK